MGTLQCCIQVQADEFSATVFPKTTAWLNSHQEAFEWCTRRKKLQLKLYSSRTDFFLGEAIPDCKQACLHYYRGGGLSAEELYRGSAIKKFDRTMMEIAARMETVHEKKAHVGWRALVNGKYP